MSRITSRAEVERMLCDGWLLLIHAADPNGFCDCDLVRGGETTSPWRNAVSSLLNYYKLEHVRSDDRGNYYRLGKPAK